jgi:hypothetical protein
MSEMRRFSTITLGAGYSEERIASPSILIGRHRRPKLPAARGKLAVQEPR